MLHVICNNCDTIVLTAQHEFDDLDTLVLCPNCDSLDQRVESSDVEQYERYCALCDQPCDSMVDTEAGWCCQRCAAAIAPPARDNSMTLFGIFILFCTVFALLLTLSPVEWR